MDKKSVVVQGSADDKHPSPGYVVCTCSVCARWWAVAFKGYKDHHTGRTKARTCVRNRFTRHKKVVTGRCQDAEAEWIASAARPEQEEEEAEEQEEEEAEEEEAEEDEDEDEDEAEVEDEAEDEAEGKGE
jgi:hypothetical protein